MAALKVPSALVKLHSRLPSRWPTQDKPGVNAEDYWYQAIIDQLCILFDLPRNPVQTLSAEAIRAAGPPYGGSSNHKRFERTVEMIRDQNPKVVVQFFQEEKRDGMCMQEMGARYMPRFHNAGVLAAWIVAKYWGHRVLQTECERWLSWFKWWLTNSAFLGPKPRKGPYLKPMIYSGGLRREYTADPRDTYHYWLHTGTKAVDPATAAGGTSTRGGYPGTTDVYLACAAKEFGLDFEALKARKPPMMYELLFVRGSGTLLSYFPMLKWRPGNGPIMAGVEVTPKRVTEWLVEEEDKIPAPTWGFDPVRRDVMPVKGDGVADRKRVIHASRV